MLRFLLIGFLSLFLGEFYGQDRYLENYGNIVEHQSGSLLDDVIIEVFMDGNLWEKHITGESGYFDVYKMPFNHLFELRFTKPGYFPRVVEIDVLNIPDGALEDGWSVNINISLISGLDEGETSFDNPPKFRAKYFIWQDEIHFYNSQESVAEVRSYYKDVWNYLLRESGVDLVPIYWVN